jgi:hypothetical protein
MSGKTLLAILGALGLTVAPAAVQAASSTSAGSEHRASTGAPVFVDLFARSNPGSGSSVAHKARPFLPTNAANRPSHPAAIGTLQPLQATNPLLTQVASFPLISLDAQVSALGVDQAAEPPDTMLAAGPTSLLEMVNSSVSIWSKSGTRLAIADLNKVLPMPTGFSFSDPRVLFDVASGRFFFSGVGFSLTYNSVVFLGVSKTSDPAGGFFVYKVAQTSNGQLHDQPKIGVSDDKVVISWNEFCCHLLATFRGAETFVFEKATLLTGSVTPVYFVGPNLDQSSPVPAQSLSSTTTEFVTFNHTTFAGVLAITGTPALNNVVITETDIPIPATTVPPKAIQPAGTINTNDDRFLSSIWNAGNLWVSGNDGCTPSGSLIRRSCLRLVRISAISTGGMTPSLTQSVDVGQNGVDLYYPAVTLDSAQNLFVSFSASTSSVFPSAAALEIAGGPPPATIVGAKVFQLGAKTYGGTRWGDYSAISVDPATGVIWAAAEYSAAGSTRNWGTAAAAFTP